MKSKMSQTLTGSQESTQLIRHIKANYNHWFPPSLTAKLLNPLTNKGRLGFESSEQKVAFIKERSLQILGFLLGPNAQGGKPQKKKFLTPHPPPSNPTLFSSCVTEKEPKFTAHNNPQQGNNTATQVVCNFPESEFTQTQYEYQTLIGKPNKIKFFSI